MITWELLKFGFRKNFTFCHYFAWKHLSQRWKIGIKFSGDKKPQKWYKLFGWQKASKMVSVSRNHSNYIFSDDVIISRHELIMLENLVYDISNYTKWFTKFFLCDSKIITPNENNPVEISMCDLKSHLVWLFCSIFLCRPVWL